MCHICSILAYPFKPRPLKNVPIHDMVTLQVKNVGFSAQLFIKGLEGLDV